MAEVAMTEHIGEPLRIVPLQESDWEQFKDIRLKALIEEPKAFGDEGSRGKWEYTPDIWRSKLTATDRRWLGAKNAQGDLVGIIGAMIGTEELGQHVGRITSFYLDKAYRRGGNGRALFGQMISTLQDIPQLTDMQLEVTSSQDAAIKMYKRFGFEQVATLSGEVEVDGQLYDELVMRRKIQRT